MFNRAAVILLQAKNRTCIIMDEEGYSYSLVMFDGFSDLRKTYKIYIL